LENLADAIVRQVELLPGVESVSVSNQPLAGGGSNGFMSKTPDGRPMGFGIVAVRPNFFSTMRIPYRAGRQLNAADNASARKVMVVNERFARDYFPNSNAVGAMISMNNSQVEIVGVVGDAKLRNVREDIGPVAYAPYPQMPQLVSSLTFSVRTAFDPAGVATAIRETVRQVDSTLPISNLRTQQQAIERTLTQERLFAGLSATLGAIGLLLTCVGLYGLMSYSVARRIHEFGIRMALGATRGNVIRPVLLEAAAIVGAGLLLGFVGGQIVVRILSEMLASFLYRLEPSDPVVLATAAVAVFVAGLVAGYIPAMRASRVDPSSALRCE
jgi:predicted permease